MKKNHSFYCRKPYPDIIVILSERVYDKNGDEQPSNITIESNRMSHDYLGIAESTFLRKWDGHII